MKEVFGSGTFKVNPKYYLYDKSVEANINIKNEAARYQSIIRKLEEETKEYFDESIKKYELAEIDDIGWVKVYKNLP